MPLVFTLFMGFAYKGGEEGAAQEEGMTLAWVEDTPSSSLGQELFRRLEQAGMLQMERMAEDEARQSFATRPGGWCVLMVPAGFDGLAQAGHQWADLDR